MSDLMTEHEVAELLRLTRQTLSRWRAEDRGPAFLKIEGTIRYRREDVQAWLDKSGVKAEKPLTAADHAAMGH